MTDRARIPALDGLRGVAVLLVFVGHLFGGMWPDNVPFAEWTTWVRGRGPGLVGVQLFFALSGYLITLILLAEIERTGAVKLRSFWARRARRLYPALVATSLVLLAIAYFGPRPDRVDAALNVAEALTYTTNLHWSGVANWLGHTWTLAVEEQVYVVWPLVLIGAYLIAGRVGVGAAALVLAAGIAVLRMYVHREPLLYDLIRWDAPLLGCAAAALRFQPGRWVLWLAAGGLAWYSLAMYEPGPWKFTLTAVACAIAVAGASRTRWLENGVLCYFGHRSYGLYLWSCLILRFGLPGPVSLALSLVVTELSWRYVERPWLIRPSSRAASEPLRQPTLAVPSALPGDS